MPMTTTPPQVTADGRYSVAQAAQACNVNRRTIYNWIRSGELHVKHRRNGRCIILGSEITRYWKATLF